MGSWTFGRKVAFGFGLAVVMLGLVGFVAYRAADTLIDNNSHVTGSYALVGKLQSVLSLMKDAETGQRGFVITGDEGFLDPYNAATANLPRALDDLERLAGQDAQYTRDLQRARALVQQKLDELLKVLEARRDAGFEAAQKLITAGAGKRLMDDIRTAYAGIEETERARLAERTANAEAGAQTGQQTILFGAVLALALVTLAGFFISRSLTNTLGVAINDMRSSSTELEAAATQQATSAREQASATHEVSTTIRELLATSKQIAESAQRVSRIAEDTASGARGGDELVSRTKEGLQAIRRQVEVIVGHMLELGKKSQQAGNILEIINELAEQTNILAINATIEAAGAGEAGRRFAVVADEIRKLADRVGGSTKEIRALIDDIRAAVNTTVMATESGTKAVEAGARQFADVTRSFDQIVALVGTTTEAAREIGLSTKQQTSAVEQVDMAIHSVAQATKETEASSKQTLQTAQQLAHLSRDLTRLIRNDYARERLPEPPARG